ncbi:MAG: universal stress protein [Chitinophagales bacterium]|nr:universal stress protein [Chitinophagales bacterium]
MKKILLPTDFSDVSINAYNYALHIAEQFEAEVRLFFVYCYPMIDPHMPQSMILSMDQAEEAEAMKKFKEHEALLPHVVSGRNLDKVKVTHTLRTGFLIQEILELAKKEEFDMIIMGTHGASGVSEYVLGSNTAEIMQKAEVPVLAIPGDADYSKIDRIVYATDFDKSDFKSMGSLLKLARKLDAKVTSLHIKTEKGINEDVKLDDWQEYFWSEVKSGIVKFAMIEDEDVMHGLNRYIEENDVDMIAMLTHKKSLTEKIFSRSMTKKMAYHSEVPILAFHE